MTRLIVALWVLMALVVMFVLTHAEAQTPTPPACANLLECQRERVADFRDYTEWLQSELAFAKAINKALNHTLNEKQKEIDALKAKLPPEPKPEGTK